MPSNPSARAEPDLVPDVAEHGVDRLAAGGAGRIHETAASVQRLCSLDRLGDTEIRRVILQPDRQCHDPVHGGCDIERPFHPERGLEDRHQPYPALGELPDSLVDRPDGVGVLDLRNQDHVRLFRGNRSQIVQAQRQRVDPHHSLRAHEVHRAQQIPYDETRGVLVARVDGVLQVEDHAVRPVQPRIDRQLGLISRQVEPRSTKAVTSRRLARENSPLRSGVTTGNSRLPQCGLDSGPDHRIERTPVLDAQLRMIDPERLAYPAGFGLDRPSVQPADPGGEIDLHPALVCKLHRREQVRTDVRARPARFAAAGGG
jgi:hypothetical protein